jgi:hypothetical protein
LYSVKKIAATFGATILVSGILLLPSSPAAAATCAGRVTYGVTAGTGSATMYNSTSTSSRCALVQVKIRGYLGGGVYQNYLGPQNASSSHRDATANSYTWYGRAVPSSSWVEKQWTRSGDSKFFEG